MIKVGDKVRVKYLDDADKLNGYFEKGDIFTVSGKYEREPDGNGWVLDVEENNDVCLYENQVEVVASDLINHPPHYTSAGMETIDKMEFFFGTKALKIYCTINAYKYDSRAGLKDDVQKEGEKSTWYINKANELQEKIDNGEGILGSLDYLLE